VLNRVHPDDVALVRQVINRAMTHKKAFDFEHRLLMPDGSVKHLDVVAHPLIDEPGELRFVGAVMDVTARKKSKKRCGRASSGIGTCFSTCRSLFGR